MLCIQLDTSGEPNAQFSCRFSYSYWNTKNGYGNGESSPSFFYIFTCISVVWKVKSECVVVISDYFFLLPQSDQGMDSPRCYPVPEELPMSFSWLRSSWKSPPSSPKRRDSPPSSPFRWKFEPVEFTLKEENDCWKCKHYLVNDMHMYQWLNSFGFDWLL